MEIWSKCNVTNVTVDLTTYGINKKQHIFKHMGQYNELQTESNTLGSRIIQNITC